MTDYYDDHGHLLGSRDRREFGVRWSDGPPLEVAGEAAALALRDRLATETGADVVVVSRVVRVGEWREW